MDFVPALEQGILIRRYKRFLADVRTATGEELCIHCPNTGSMLNCLPKEGRVWFQRHNNPKRRLPATWELVETPQGRLACINTQRANALVAEALQKQRIPELAGFSQIQSEVPCLVGNSRLDFALRYPNPDRVAYVEVKSVTLGFEQSTVAAFPDAVTARGLKHLQALTELVRSGVRAVLFYCVNLSEIQAVRPAREIDPKYAMALAAAQAAGVELLAYGTRISPQSIELTHALPVVMDGSS